MGGCANSKYAVDEADKSETKKSKKPLSKKNSNKNGSVNKKGEADGTTAAPVKEAGAATNGTVVAAAEDHERDHEKENTTPVQAGEAPKVEKEDIEFIDKDETTAKTTTTTSTNDDDTKKEVTTYQTTVVKHTQKEGDELLQHLKDEAFRTLQNTLKQLNATQQTTTKTTSASLNDNEPQTNVDAANTADDLVNQVKAQVVTSLGKSKQELIHTVIDSGVALIRDNKCKNMNELQAELERQYPDNDGELVKKIINATTGFLTAKGTEAGALLSNILANVTTGIQGVMNETEKTTVKVTRTITEQVLSGGQLKEINRVISTASEQAPSGSNIGDLLRNLSSGDKIIKTGSVVTSTNTVVNEQHENVTKDEAYTVKSDDDLIEKAEKVVNKVVNAAVEKINHEDSQKTDNDANANAEQQPQPAQETNTERVLDEQVTEENIKIEEESTVRMSTTKIILNGSDAEIEHVELDTNTRVEPQTPIADEPQPHQEPVPQPETETEPEPEPKLEPQAEEAQPKADEEVVNTVAQTATTDLEQVQSEFFKTGKLEAEEAIKKFTQDEPHDSIETEQVENQLESTPQQSAIADVIVAAAVAAEITKTAESDTTVKPETSPAN